jgi:hypothetical protein
MCGILTEDSIEFPVELLLAVAAPPVAVEVEVAEELELDLLVEFDRFGLLVTVLV